MEIEIVSQMIVIDDLCNSIIGVMHDFNKKIKHNEKFNLISIKNDILDNPNDFLIEKLNECASDGKIAEKKLKIDESIRKKIIL